MKAAQSMDGKWYATNTPRQQPLLFSPIGKGTWVYIAMEEDGVPAFNPKYRDNNPRKQLVAPSVIGGRNSRWRREDSGHVAAKL